LEEANSKFYKDLEEKLNPKFIHFEFDTFNPDLDLGSLTLNTQDSGNSQTQSQSTSQTTNKQGDTGTTDDDVMNEDGEVKAVVVSRNRFLKGMETTDSPKGTVYQNQTKMFVTPGSLIALNFEPSQSQKVSHLAVLKHDSCDMNNVT